MLKETITYTDYNGVERTEDFYFNISKSELAMMELSQDGGFEAMLKRVIASNDIKKIAEIFEDIILKAYGEKSEDGRRFIKSPEISKAFKETEAFNSLFMRLISDGGEAAKFTNGIIPPQMTPSSNVSSLPPKTN